MTPAARETIARHAALARRRLPGSIVPYWLETTRDDVHGGYLLLDDIPRPWLRRIGRRVRKALDPPATADKLLVDQARLLWVFSHAHRTGVDRGGASLQAASSGYRFLREAFLDEVHGGYAWATDRAGRLLNPVKHLYGQAFVIYGFVEYARVSGDRRALQDAIELYRTIDEELHDDAHGGWREHGDRRWKPVATDDPRIGVDRAGSKSGNAMVHWVEALAELAAETGDTRVRASLAEALAVARRFLFPSDPNRACAYRRSDWMPVPGAEDRVPYGHSVEFAWLMVRAQRVLAIEPAWEEFRAYLDHTLRYGFDHDRGGVFPSGPRGERATPSDKPWWVQYELVAALVEALRERDDDRYVRALATTVTFLEHHMVDRRDGVAFDWDDASSRPRRKAGHWKAGYHEVRATVMLADAFAD